MMISRGLIGIAFVMVVAAACDTSSNVDPIYKDHFIKTFGGDGDQEGVDILVNDDNTITMLGNTIDPLGLRKIYFLKTDLEGKILIEKQFGDSNEGAKDIEPIQGGYVILSNVYVDENRYDIKLLRTDPNGVVIDSVVFDDLGDQFGNSVTVTSNNHFYVIGNTRDTDVDGHAGMVGIEDKEDLLIVEFDTDLTVLKTFRIGRSSKGMGIKLFESGSTFTYAGYSDETRVSADTNTNFIFRSFKYDPREVGTLFVGDDVAREKMSSFVKMPNGSFYGIGTEVSGTGLSKVFISNVVNSTEIPVKLFSGTIGDGTTLEGISGYPSVNGSSIFVLADEYSLADETRDIRLLRVNAFTGAQDWSRQLGSQGDDEMGSALAELPNGDIVVVGTVNLINQHKLVLMKVNSEGGFN